MNEYSDIPIFFKKNSVSMLFYLSKIFYVH